ncbi:MAG: M15 family metallopeptidase [Acidimicrobiales bacterium]
MSNRRPFGVGQRGPRASAALVGACLLAACAGPGAPAGPPPGAGGSDPPPGGPPSPVVTSAAPAPSSPPPTAATAPAATTPTTASPPAGPVTTDGSFVFQVDPLPAATRQGMTGPAWREGCPVPLDDLRTVRLSFWGFDGAPHVGTLVVHADTVPAVRQVFSALHDAHWPIRQMRPIEDFGGDDDASGEADNTSAFNCRQATGSTSTWSEHAYGRAIDINPRENPYVTGTRISPAAGAAFLDRTAPQPGLITASSVVVTAFSRQGWGWGGHWSSIKDYQHFSATGR